MVSITLQRDKCIGCGYCHQVASEYFDMSATDGKSILISSREKKGFFTLRTADPTAYEVCRKAQDTCPVKIIRVVKTK